LVDEGVVEAWGDGVHGSSALASNVERQTTCGGRLHASTRLLAVAVVVVNKRESSRDALDKNARAVSDRTRPPSKYYLFALFFSRVESGAILMCGTRPS